jgi:hypothetical protein
MKKLFYFFIIILGFVSCSKISPKGEIEVKDTPVENFTKLNLKGNFKVFFAKGEQNLVSVETYPNIFSNLDIDEEDGTLTIEEGRKPENVDFYTITIFGKNELSEITLADHVEMNISGQIKSPQFSLNVKDNAKFMGAVASQKSNVTMSQKSNANILGQTKSLTLRMADSASIVAPYFYAENLDILAKNDAFAGVNVENEMKGAIENTSKLVFYGEPLNKVVKKDKASVENRKLK